MNIPHKAVEAFQDAIEQSPGWLSAETILEALKAAAPIIAAQALRDAAADLGAVGMAQPSAVRMVAIGVAQEELRNRADGLEVRA